MSNLLNLDIKRNSLGGGFFLGENVIYNFGEEYEVKC